ncbi:MAG: hypothetical protein AB1705_07885 [Verrucomicrobiota bacterium]
MNEQTKRNLRAAFRLIEFLVAVALLAVTLELVLIHLTTPGQFPEYRWSSRSSPDSTAGQRPGEGAKPDFAQQVEAKKPAAAAKAQPPVGAPPGPPVQRRPRPVTPDRVLAFENLRRVVRDFFGGEDGGADGGVAGGGNGGGGSSPAIVSTIVILPGTNSPADGASTNRTNNSGATVSGSESNRTNTTGMAAVNTGSRTNLATSAERDRNDPNAFRLAIP